MLAAHTSIAVGTSVQSSVTSKSETVTQAAAQEFQPTVQETLNWILSLGLSPLPVAPAQDAHAYPLRDKQGVIQYEKDGVTPKQKFTGKNPSYLDAKNVPHLVTHSKFLNRQPSKRDLETWFANPLNGIGTLGNPECIWLDFDVKNFTDAVECSVKAWAIAGKIKELSGHEPTVERTHSEGWRVQVYVPEKPTFTNFALEPDGKHVGEALGAGRFTVLAPTVGVSGQPYVVYHRHAPESKPLVPCLEAIGVHPSGKSKAMPSTSTPIANKSVPATPTEVPTPKTLPSTAMISEYPEFRGKIFELSELGTPLSKEVLNGSDEKGDRSASLTLAIKEWYGWENWCRFNGITYRGDTRTLALEAGEKLGIDAERVQRILDGIDANACTTACEYKSGDDNGCWKRILRLADANDSPKGGKGFAKPRAELTPQEKAKVRKLEAQFPTLTEDGDEPTPKRAKKPPSPKRVAEALAEEYRERWKYWCEKRQWMEFDGKVWRVVDAEAFVAAVWHLLKSKGIEWELPVYVENVVKALKNELLVTEWPMWSRKRYIAFADAVLDNETGELLNFEPGMGFLSHLPYDYAELPNATDDPIEALQAHCPKIFAFMNRAMGGSRKRLLKLLAVVNGAIKFRFFDLQMFVHLVGKPGTGKGTFSRILGKVIGSANAANTTLAALDEPTELAAVIDKQLVTCPDERRQHGIDTLLRLTGGDKVRYREIYKPRGEGFFYALLLILSNTPVFSGDVTGLKRRLCLVEFVNPIPKNLRDTSAERQMEAEIPALIPIALMLSDSQVASLIKGLGDDAIPEFKRQEWEMQIQVNPLAAWANEWLIHDSEAELAVGNGAFETQGESFERGFDVTTAYGNYLAHCRVTGVTRPLTRNTFSPTLEGVCHEVLEWDDVKRKRNKRGVVFQGLRLRRDGETTPWVEETFEREGVHRCRPDVDQGVDLKALPRKGGVDYADLCGKNECVDVDAVNALLAEIEYEALYGANWEVVFASSVAKLEKAFTQSANAETDTPLVTETGENETSTPQTPDETIEKLAAKSTTSTPALPHKGFGSTPESTPGSSPGLHRCTPDTPTLTSESAPEPTEAPTSEPEAQYPNLVGKRIKCVRQGTMYGKVFEVKSQDADVYYWGRHGDYINCADWEEIQSGAWKILE